MKKYIAACAGLTAVGMAILLSVLPGLPAQVPMHWNAAGEMDRMGSKYEYLIIIGMGILFAALIIVLGERVTKNAMEKRILGLTAVFELFLFFGISFFAIWQGARYMEEPEPMDVEIVFRATGILLGILLVALGNVLPKFRKNRFIGIRFPWTMESDAVWQRSQRFGGICAVVTGLLLLLLSFLLHGIALLVVILIVPGFWAVLTAVVSWRYYKEEQRKS